MSQVHVTCSRGFPASVRFLAGETSSSALVLTRLRYRVHATGMALESPADEESVRRSESVAHHDFETGPWPQMFDGGQTMVRVAAGGSDPSRSLEVPAGIFSAVYGGVADALSPSDPIALPDTHQAAGYRVVEFGAEAPWVYEGAHVVPLKVVAFDLDPTEGIAHATYAAKTKVESGATVQISLDPFPIGDEETANIDSVKQDVGRRYATGMMSARAPKPATPFRPSTPPAAPPAGPVAPPAGSSPGVAPIPAAPVHAMPAVAPPPAVSAPPVVAAAPAVPAIQPPPPREAPLGPAPPPVRGPDAARPLLDYAPPRKEQKASTAPKPRPRPLASQVAIERLWHDEERVEAMQAAEQLHVKPETRRDGRRARRPRRRDKAPEKKPEVVVTELLRYSRPATTSSLRTVLHESLASEDGDGEPMLLLEGQLHFSFDPRTELETIVSLARPLAKGTGTLAEDIEHVDALLTTPIEGAPELARRMADKIRKSWKDSNRSLPDDYLTTATERVLITQRAYQKIQLFGVSCIRAELAVDAHDRSANRVVTYLPEEVGAELPLFAELSVRIIGIVHLRQDVAEDSPVAFRCIALGRRTDR